MKRRTVTLSKESTEETRQRLTIKTISKAFLAPYAVKSPIKNHHGRRLIELIVL